MSDSIRLSEDRGVNPRMTTCPSCGKDGPELLLLGDADYLFQCRNCNANVLAPKNGPSSCPKCKATRPSFNSKYEFPFVRRLAEHEKLPGGLCDACVKSHAELRDAVAAGGVFWKCKDCKASGALKASAPLSQHVREQMKIAAPDPCGVEFTQKECPACGPNKVVESPRSPSPGGP